MSSVAVNMVERPEEGEKRWYSRLRVREVDVTNTSVPIQETREGLRGWIGMARDAVGDVEDRGEKVCRVPLLPIAATWLPSGDQEADQIPLGSDRDRVILASAVPEVDRSHILIDETEAASTISAVVGWHARVVIALPLVGVCEASRGSLLAMVKDEIWDQPLHLQIRALLRDWILYPPLRYDHQDEHSQSRLPHPPRRFLLQPGSNPNPLQSLPLPYRSSHPPTPLSHIRAR